MNTCQHCQTELSNPRAKNCKTCSELLNEAYKNGGYDLAMEAIGESKEAGLAGSEIHNAIREAIQAGRNRNNQWINDYRKRLIERREEESKKIDFYRTHGYYPGQKFNDEDVRIDIEEARNFKPSVSGESELFG